MNRETATALNRRLLAHVTSGTTELAESEVRLSCDILLDPVVHALERDRLFTHTPQPVAFSGELPEPLTSLAITVLDTPVLLTRNTAGQLRAFINACRHRGAQVSHGSAAGREVVLKTPCVESMLASRPAAQVLPARQLFSACHAVASSVVCPL